MSTDILKERTLKLSCFSVVIGEIVVKVHAPGPVFRPARGELDSSLLQRLDLNLVAGKVAHKLVANGIRQCCRPLVLPAFVEQFDQVQQLLVLQQGNARFKAVLAQISFGCLPACRQFLTHFQTLSQVLQPTSLLSICILWNQLLVLAHPSNERVERIRRRRLPHVQLTIAIEVLPEFLLQGLCLSTLPLSLHVGLQSLHRLRTSLHRLLALFFQ
mmetsp:Transcript_49120/g.110122  ORF Transcript_49120/g.110122 Transcript_49120/m.110122 type:complete len:215 (+) Transcript_49120:54-698(+)